jgi:hypothetical protein
VPEVRCRGHAGEFSSWQLSLGEVAQGKSPRDGCRCELSAASAGSSWETEKKSPWDRGGAPKGKIQVSRSWLQWKKCERELELSLGCRSGLGFTQIKDIYAPGSRWDAQDRAGRVPNAEPGRKPN